jgi:hypothetical protein
VLLAQLHRIGVGLALDHDARPVDAGGRQQVGHRLRTLQRQLLVEVGATRGIEPIGEAGDCRLLQLETAAPCALQQLIQAFACHRQDAGRICSCEVEQQRCRIAHRLGQRRGRR